MCQTNYNDENKQNGIKENQKYFFVIKTPKNPMYNIQKAI